MRDLDFAETLRNRSTGIIQRRAKAGSTSAVKDRGSAKEATGFLFDKISIAAPQAQAVAQDGVAGASSALPYHDVIQRSFGRHDLRTVRAAIGGPARHANQSLGAEAYTQGERVGFVGAPNLFTAAHEAAHVIQQRNGLVSVHGRSHDAFEHSADRVAQTVVRGGSAESLIDAEIGRADYGWARSLRPRASLQLKAAEPHPAMETRDASGNDKRLVEFERRLFAVIRDNQASYASAVEKVSRFCRNLMQRYRDQYRQNFEEEAKERLLGIVHRPELATPEFLNQRAPADYDDKIVFAKWEQLANGTRGGSVDLQLFFQRTIFDTLLDQKEIEKKDEKKKKPPGKAFKNTAQLMKDYRAADAAPFDPYAPRNENAIKDFFQKPNRDRDKAEPRLERIVGNVPVMNPTESSILRDSDPNAMALVGRGTDANLFQEHGSYVQRTTDLGLPLAALISGSTADYVLLAQLAGLSADEAHKYAMAVLYYLGLPGHHSFDEIAIVLAANKLFEYNPQISVGDYDGPLTKEIRDSAGYRKLAAEYPELLVRGRRR